MRRRKGRAGACRRIDRRPDSRFGALAQADSRCPKELPQRSAAPAPSARNALSPVVVVCGLFGRARPHVSHAHVPCRRDSSIHVRYNQQQPPLLERSCRLLLPPMSRTSGAYLESRSQRGGCEERGGQEARAGICPGERRDGEGRLGMAPVCHTGWPKGSAAAALEGSDRRRAKGGDSGHGSGARVRSRWAVYLVVVRNRQGC
jgi:hypothetical protein